MKNKAEKEIAHVVYITDRFIFIVLVDLSPEEVIKIDRDEIPEDIVEDMLFAGRIHGSCIAHVTATRPESCSYEFSGWEVAL